MYRRLHAQLAAIALLPLLAGGCVQMTRHSNMMIFGTNTVVGVRAGVNATSVPEVSIGYTRQEAVVLPLVANVAESRIHPDQLVPCDPGARVEVAASATGAAEPKFIVHPCLLVATNGSAQDSYSVLASFGADFDGSATPSQANVKGGLAQYFATGMAAQLLAASGGAAVVATGPAAVKSAEQPLTNETVNALFGNEEAFNRGVTSASAVVPFTDKLLALISQQPDNATVENKIIAFELRAGIQTTLRTKCATQSGCITAIKRGDYDQPYNMNQSAMDQALISF